MHIMLGEKHEKSYLEPIFKTGELQLTEHKWFKKLVPIINNSEEMMF